MATKTYTGKNIHRLDDDIVAFAEALMVEGTRDLMRYALPLAIETTPEEQVDSDGERMRDKWTVRINGDDFRRIAEVALGDQAGLINYDAGAAAIDFRRGRFTYDKSNPSYTRKKGVAPDGISKPVRRKTLKTSEGVLSRTVAKVEARFGSA